MITEELLQRINELAHKKKCEGLTLVELDEQKKLYKIYLGSIRKQVISTFENAGIANNGHQDSCYDGCREHHHHGKNCNHDRH